MKNKKSSQQCNDLNSSSLARTYFFYESIDRRFLERYREERAPYRFLLEGYGTSISLIPRWIFTGDCYTPYPGEISDKLDRAYRKSNYTRNRNQFNDVLFWSWCLFAEGVVSIESYLDPHGFGEHAPAFHITGQVSVISSRSPKVEEKKEYGDDEDEEISAVQILDSFLREEH